jgi:hypothetical protein
MAGVAAAVGPALPAEAVVDDDGQAILDAWIDALFTGEVERVAPLLAPELQVLRGDGKSHDKASYLAALPKYKSRPQTSDLKATSEVNSLVISYTISSDQTIEGQPVAAVAPRLTVFRRKGSQWLVVAHSNFAKVG